MEKIAVDTESLAADIRSLREQLQGAQGQAEQILQSITELDAMWTGAANETFHEQFQNDYEMICELLKTMDAITQCMEYAKTEYDDCEKQVDSKIAAMNIR